MTSKKSIKINIGLDTVADETRETLFKSAQKVLSLDKAQFYNPYFDVLNKEEASKNPNICLDNKYKVVGIDYIIDSDEESEYTTGNRSSRC